MERTTKRATKRQVEDAKARIIDAVWHQAGITQKELVALSGVVYAVTLRLIREAITEGHIMETISQDKRQKAYIQAN